MCCSTTRCSGSWSCSGAGHTPARARNANTARRQPSPSGRTLGWPHTRSGRRTGECSNCSKGIRQGAPTVHAPDGTTPCTGTRVRTQNIDPFEQNRQKQVVGLIRTNFLKALRELRHGLRVLVRPPSSGSSLAFAEVHSESEAEKRLLERWKAQNAEVLDKARHRQYELWADEDDDADDEDVVTQEMLEDVVRLDRAVYRVEEMLSETFSRPQPDRAVPRRGTKVRAEA